jgi:hypothetical protein
MKCHHLRQSLQGFRKLSDSGMDSFFGNELADQGVIGGEISLDMDKTLPLIEVDFWVNSKPSTSFIELLERETSTQLKDGFGEGGFEFEIGEQTITVYASGYPIETHVTDDGRAASGPNRIAIAARDGDITALTKAIKAKPNEVNRLLKGFPPLHLAILYGHLEALEVLLAAGANPNLGDSIDGDTPLMICALVNSQTDETCRDFARLLIDAGANPNVQNSSGRTAKYYAESRDKKLLSEIL